jgi:predicted nucleotidyltransferase
MSTVKEISLTAHQVAQEFSKKVHALVPSAVVKLYGSAARGEMEELSDIDIYVELPDEVEMDAVRDQISDIVWEVGFEHDQIIQTVIYQKSEVWNSPLRSSPFIKAVLREGVTI